MRRRNFLKKAGGAVVVSGIFSRVALSKDKEMKNGNLKQGEVQHMVIFNLPYPKGSDQAMKFLKDGTRILSAIPVVRDFQAFKQVSAKNDYQYGFSMVFTNREDYSTYNNHPAHVSFVKDRWEKEVSEFLEIDFETPA